MKTITTKDWIDLINENKQLHTQLAKANGRVALLERVEKIFNESPELTFENVKSMFSEELNKFSIEKKIEALKKVAYETSYDVVSDACNWEIEQLRKEQECE